MANLNVLGKKINKGYSRNHNQYSAFIPEKHAYTQQRRKMTSRVFLIIVCAIAVIVLFAVQWLYTH